MGVGPQFDFIRFPAQELTLSHGNSSRENNQKAIAARTGGETVNGEEGGGQPLGLSVAFQYQLIQGWIPDVYEIYGQQWESTYLRLAQQAITNVAQQFTPRQFWLNRRAVERQMLLAVNKTLTTNGKAVCRSLQLRSVQFQSSYEQTITNIQLQEQLKVTKSYQLEVTRVQKEVDLLQSTTDATIAVINAEADRSKRVLEGAANADALQREQRAKAEMYRRLTEHMSWGSNDFLKYIKMKALNGQVTQNNVVVGVSPMGTIK